MSRPSNKAGKILKSCTYSSEHHPELHDTQDYYFFCPGCESIHKIRAAGAPPVWTFNGDLEKPTFSPSHLTGLPDDKGVRFAKNRCHSFIEDGNIRFLGDCHHKLNGQTVPIPPYPEWLDD